MEYYLPQYFCLLFFTVKYLFKKEGNSPKHLDALGFYILIGTDLGARLGICLFYDPVYYLSNPLEMFLPFK
jgi:phosphatidylglycerol:prolipoprotein diacylglycerol transferase